MSFLWRFRVISFYTIISIVMLLFFIFFCIPIQLVGAPYFIPYQLSVIFSYIYIYLIWIICGVKFKLEGYEKLPRNKKPYIALANHQSFWENFFMQLIIPKHSWVVKQELLDIPIFGKCLGALRPIAVDRKNYRSVVQILAEGQRKIDEGLSIVIFPEATRVPVNRNVKFKASAAKLALNTNVPIALIAHNAGLICPKAFWFKQPGTITVKIIEVISAKEASQMNERELNAHIQDKITLEKNKLVELGARHKEQ